MGLSARRWAPLRRSGSGTPLTRTLPHPAIGRAIRRFAGLYPAIAASPATGGPHSATGRAHRWIHRVPEVLMYADAPLSTETWPLRGQPRSCLEVGEKGKLKAYRLPRRVPHRAGAFKAFLREHDCRLTHLCAPDRVDHRRRANHRRGGGARGAAAGEYQVATPPTALRRACRSPPSSRTAGAGPDDAPDRWL